MAVTALRALARGSTRRCPHCGLGPLFQGRWRIALRERCPSCGLKYVRNQGDHWAFLLFTDRALFIFPVVVALYFRMYRLGVFLFGAFAVVVISVLILTTPHRYGFCIALNYLVRARWPQEDDPLPGHESGSD